MSDAEVKPPGPRPTDERFFVYWNGTKEVAGDPLAIARKLERACPDYLDLLETVGRTVPAEMLGSMGNLTEQVESEKDAANEKLLAATRTAFGVAAPEIREGVVSGMAEDETAQLLVAFVFWMGRAAEDPQVAVFSTSQPRASPSIPPDSAPANSAASGSSGT